MGGDSERHSGYSNGDCRYKDIIFIRTYQLVTVLWLRFHCTCLGAVPISYFYRYHLIRSDKQHSQVPIKFTLSYIKGVNHTSIGYGKFIDSRVDLIRDKGCSQSSCFLRFLKILLNLPFFQWHYYKQVPINFTLSYIKRVCMGNS